MLKQFLTDLKLHRSGPLIVLAASLVGAVIGIPLGLALRQELPAGSFFCMSTLLSLIIGLIVFFFTGCFSYSLEFRLALSMGRTRKAFMFSYCLRLLLNLLLIWCVAVILYLIEPLLYGAAAPDRFHAYFYAFLYEPGIILPAISALLLVTWFLGALYSNFGRKGLWGFYVVWLFCCFILPRIFDSTPEDGVLDQLAAGLGRGLTALPAAVLWLAGGLILLGLLYGIIRMGRKQPVKL